MPDSQDVDYLKPYIESSIEAATRFRRVLIVMVTLSILAFGAAWNSRRDGWFNLRLRLAAKAEQYLSLKEKSARLAQIERALATSSGDTVATNDRKRLEEDRENILREANDVLRSDGQNHPWLDSSGDIDRKLKCQEFDKAKEWVFSHGFYESTQARQYGQQLDQSRIANIVLLRTPLVGTIFDINDLGLVGGFALMVILLMFRFTLWREYNNLWVTFRQAKSEHLEYCYRSLAMQQVLTVPPALSGTRPVQKPWGTVVRALYFLPFVVQLTILVNDVRTADLGFALDQWATWGSLCFSAVWLVLTGFLTVWCVRLSTSIDEEWKKWALKARRKKSQAWSGSF